MIGMMSYDHKVNHIKYISLQDPYRVVMNSETCIKFSFINKPLCHCWITVIL